jgi:hypothetical protein
MTLVRIFWQVLGILVAALFTGLTLLAGTMAYGILWDIGCRSARYYLFVVRDPLVHL